jgi:hypothetical protein
MRGCVITTLLLRAELTSIVERSAVATYGCREWLACQLGGRLPVQACNPGASCLVTITAGSLQML